MTTVVVEATTRGAPSLGVIAELARFEGRRMLRSWLVRISLLGSAGYAVFESVDELAVLDRASVTLAWGLLPLMAAAVLIASNATLRTVDPDREELTAASPASQGFRLGGIGVGLLVPATAGFTVQLAVLAWLFTRDPVSNVVWPELVVGPAAVIGYGALSVAVTRFIRHAAVGPLLLVAVAGGTMALPYEPQQWGRYRGPEWLAFLPPWQDLIPQELAFRPSWIHLAYVVAAGAALVGVAVARFKAAEVALAVVGLGMAGVLGVAQMGTISGTERDEAASRLVGPTADLVCEEHPGVRYCALRGYEGWIDNWAGLADPVVAALPAGSAPIELRQYPTHYVFELYEKGGFSNWWWMDSASDDYGDRTRTVPIPVRWATFTEGLIFYEGYLGHQIGAAALDCRRECQGESQQAVLSWLSAQSEVGLDYLRRFLGDQPNVGYCIALTVVEHPELVPILHANWQSATDPRATYEDLGRILGISVPQGADEQGRLEGRCP